MRKTKAIDGRLRTLTGNQEKDCLVLLSVITLVGIVAMWVAIAL